MIKDDIEFWCEAVELLHELLLREWMVPDISTEQTNFDKERLDLLRWSTTGLRPSQVNQLSLGGAV